MKKSFLLAASSVVLGLHAASAEVDCIELSISVKDQVGAQQSKLLQIVEARVAAAPTCACEIVKAAIEGSAADTKTVAAIVETAIMAAPDQTRLIAQCAIAVAPDALTDVQAVLAKFDANSGEAANVATSAKGEKAPIGEVASIGNPLDFPGKGPVGPLKGGPPIFPVFPPIIINPPKVTNVNAGPPFTPPGPPPSTPPVDTPVGPRVQS
jgi:hypothetical protein